MIYIDIDGFQNCAERKEPYQQEYITNNSIYIEFCNK